MFQLKYKPPEPNLYFRSGIICIMVGHKTLDHLSTTVKDPWSVGIGITLLLSSEDSSSIVVEGQYYLVSLAITKR